MKQGPINHVALILDASTSMQHLQAEVIKVADQQIADLARLSTELDQETRISVYVFADGVECVIFDRDVLRLGSIADEYRANGNTALIDATLQGLTDLRRTAIMYGDHAFLVFVQTDGEENRSKARPADLQSSLKSLPDTWTVACLVPNARAKIYATSFGFAPGNVTIWDASSAAGMRESADTISRATSNYMNARATGLKSTTGLFSMDPSNINHKSVAQLKEVTGVQAIKVTGVAKIRDFIESKGLPFIQGSYFYPVVKRELIGKDKDVMIRHNISGKLYGGPEARALVGLPDSDTRVTPDFNPEFTLFVRSTSQNRNLVPGHDLLVVK